MMGISSTIGIGAANSIASSATSNIDTFARSRRVAWLLIMLWMINLFDLAFTILAYKAGGFLELNPVARLMLDLPWTLITFKLTMVSLGSLILFLLRRRALTELVCWLFCGIYVALAFTWSAYISILG